MYTAPAIIVAAAAALYFALYLIRRHGRAAGGVVVAGLLVSFIVFPGGRLALSRTSHLPVSQRPGCLLAAVTSGAIWNSSQINGLVAHGACKPPPPKIIVTQTKTFTDKTGSSGISYGYIDGSRKRILWRATVELVAPNSTWSVTTGLDANNYRMDYISDGVADAFRVHACVDDSESAPPATYADTSGKSYLRFYSKPSSFFAIKAAEPWAAHAQPLSISGHQLLAVSDAQGTVRAYFLPVAGLYGYCAYIDGPYNALVGGSFTLKRVTTAKDFAELKEAALAISVSDLQLNASN